MDVKILIENTINEILVESESDRNIWYHGTPDEREVSKNGSFSAKNDTTTIISKPNEWNIIQQKMKEARNNENEDLYFELLDKAGELQKNITYKKPIFFTNDYSVAKTYADPHRAFDYQNSEPNVLKVKINDSGNVLKIPAYGERFRNINLNSVKKALLNSGVSEKQLNEILSKLSLNIKNEKISAETIGIIAQEFGFDIVDVLGVLDSYHGGTIKSTVRMIFDPNRIKIIKN